MRWPRAVVTLRQVLEAEGWRAIRDRLLDRRADARRRARFRPAPSGLRFEAPVLHVLATPLSRALGGVQIQFLRRLEPTAVGGEPLALLYPHGSAYRLEMRAPGSQGHFAILGSRRPVSPVTLEDPEWESAVRSAASRVGATVVHLEGVAGMPLASMVRLAEDGRWRIRLAVHDFSLYCPRPQLLEMPNSRFCDYSRNDVRCHTCLSQSWPVPISFPLAYRQLAQRLLALAQSVTYPSDFLRRTFADLFPKLDPATQLVLEPAPPRPQSLPPKALHSDGELRIAFVGSFHVHKGARVFLDLARTTREIEGRRLRWYILGGGDSMLLREARALPGVTIRGYYRAGTLSGLLRTLGIDVALLLSVWPETYGITLDECQHAGVAIACTAAGAMAERYTGASGPALSVLARLRAEA